MQRSVWVTLMLTLGCGGGGQPPQTSDDVSGPEAPAMASAEDTESVPDSEEEPQSGGGDDGASSVSLSDEDVATMLQRVIDDEEVTSYLRLGEPGRLPLKVSGDVIPSGAELVKGEAVERVDEPAEGDAVLEFTSVEPVGDKVNVRFRFDVEGVKGSVTFQQGLRGWEILRSRITQR
jgi:hypothetical protein